MPEPLMHENDFNYFLNLLRWILQFIGAWPTPVSCSVFTKITYIIRIIVSYFLLSFTMLTNVLHIFLKEKNTRKKIKTAGISCNACIQFIKYTVILYNAKNLRKIIDRVKQDWINANEEDRQILRSKAQTGRRLVLTSVIFTFSSGLCYRTIIPFFVKRIAIAENITIRPLGNPVYIPFVNEHETPYYEIIFVLQILSGTVSYLIMTGACGISAFLVLHGCSQFRILLHRIEKLGDKKGLDDRIVQLRFVTIVELQANIKQFIKDTHEIIQYICFIETLGSTSLTCLAGFCIISEWENKNTLSLLIYCILLMSFTFSVFIFCYIGQLLDNESNNVQLTSVTVNWYRLPMDKARYLILVIAMSNYPTKIQAGKMFELSLVTFTNIMKISFTYLNILRKIE